MADTTVQSSERVRSQALNDAEELGSPVVTVVTKRIRAAKKRLSKIERIEAKAQDQPDKIDKDQVRATDRYWTMVRIWSLAWEPRLKSARFVYVFAAT